MKSDIFLSEVLEKRGDGGGAIEVCASADGKYDHAASVLSVTLDAYLQDFKGTQSRPEWLPKGETVREHVAHEELREVGHDIFHRWVKRVRETVPREIG
jgi:hypothetical protein